MESFFMDFGIFISCKPQWTRVTCIWLSQRQGGPRRHIFWGKAPWRKKWKAKRRWGLSSTRSSLWGVSNISWEAGKQPKQESNIPATQRSQPESNKKVALCEGIKTFLPCIWFYVCSSCLYKLTCWTFMASYLLSQSSLAVTGAALFAASIYLCYSNGSVTMLWLTKQ